MSFCGVGDVVTTVPLLDVVVLVVGVATIATVLAQPLVEEEGGGGVSLHLLLLLETKGRTVLLGSQMNMRADMLCYNLHDIILQLLVVLFKHTEKKKMRRRRKQRE